MCACTESDVRESATRLHSKRSIRFTLARARAFISTNDSFRYRQLQQRYVRNVILAPRSLPGFLLGWTPCIYIYIYKWNVVMLLSNTEYDSQILRESYVELERQCVGQWNAKGINMLNKRKLSKYQQNILMLKSQNRLKPAVWNNLTVRQPFHQNYWILRSWL
jgi:hypothetical protein